MDSPHAPAERDVAACDDATSIDVEVTPAKRPDDRPWPSRLRALVRTVFVHAQKHTGVGIVCAVAYFDPGNWGVDLQAGSRYGYKLLFVVLLAGLFAAFLQVLASRLGCVTGLDLATHCRLLLHDRPSRTKLYRWALLYPLYALSEIAIISTDLAELLGSAMALCMLFPRLPLWAGVLLTGFDVLFLLALKDPLGGRPVKMFEYMMSALVLAVLICMAVIISKVDVDWGDAFDGFLPAKSVFQSNALYTSVGILGATVMPHSLFLGSALATQDRLADGDVPTPEEFTLPTAPTPPPPDAEKPLQRIRQRMRPRVWLARLAAKFRAPVIDRSARPKRHVEHENHAYEFVKAHVHHGVVDMVLSLLGFAVIINAMILILSSSVFFFGAGRNSITDSASLFDAHDLIREIVGAPAATLFAIALLAAGQSASIVATLAGQSVSEGFLHWSVSPVVRRLLTRLLGLVPSMVVALAVGRAGIDTLLVASQVVLSIVLPFIVFPLILLTSSKTVMASPRQPGAGAGGGSVDFSNGPVMLVTGCAIWAVVVVANAYVVITLAMGKGG